MACDNRGRGPGSNWSKHEVLEVVLIGSLLYAVLFRKLSSRILLLLSLIFAVGITLRILTV